jgi:hypothetical protein
MHLLHPRSMHTEKSGHFDAPVMHLNAPKPRFQVEFDEPVRRLAS